MVIFKNCKKCLLLFEFLNNGPIFESVRFEMKNTISTLLSICYMSILLIIFYCLSCVSMAAVAL